MRQPNGWLKKVARIVWAVTLFTALGAFALPHGVWAADNPDLVKCGDDIKIEDRGSDICYINECSVCDLQKLAQNVLNYFLVIAMAVAALLFTNAGALYVTSSAKPGNIAKAHGMFTSTLVGLMIVLAAYLFISVIMDSLASPGGYAPWNEFLCHEAKSEHCVPKVKTMTLKPSGLEGTPTGPPQPPDDFNCSEWGGYCIEDGSAAADNCKREGHDRWVTSSNSDCKTKDDGASPVCCRPPYNKCPGECVDTEDACTKDKKGTVIPKGDLPEGACATTGAGQVCCQPKIDSGDGYCSTDFLRSAGWPENVLTKAQCVCMKESGGTNIACRPSTCDKCVPSGVVVSYGIWQINISANYSNIGCSQPVDIMYGSCSGKPPLCTAPANSACCCRNCQKTTDAAYENCKQRACDPVFNSQWAAKKYQAEGWRPWSKSASECN